MISIANQGLKQGLLTNHPTGGMVQRKWVINDFIVRNTDKVVYAHREKDESL